MSFSVILQRNKSEKNKVTKNVQTLATITGTLKSESSIVDPVILVDGDVSSYVGCNYVTISTFGRSYFVSDIKSVRNGLFEIYCHVDALSSFSSQILACKAIVKRQENVWNLYLNDGAFRVYQNPNILTKEFPSGFSTFQFILAVAGG